MPDSRRLIFLSHATPQDNAFAGWLAAQLAIAGYEVWCDVSQLLGGEKFWEDIAEAIDSYAFRVLFASTLESNRKPGTQRELKLALEAQTKHGIKDFVVPLKVDQFPFEATLESIRDLNFVRFDDSWEVGLGQLLKLLEREGAAKSPLAGPACVLEWYERSTDRRRRHVVREDTCSSNWFDLTLPQRISFHCFSFSEERLKARVKAFALPFRQVGNCLVTFAALHEIQEAIGGDGFLRTVEAPTSQFIEHGLEDLGIAAFDASNIASDLIRQAWDSTIAARGLDAHQMASGFSAWFFPNNKLDKNRAHFLLNGIRRYRQLVGRKSKRTLEGGRVPDGYWHYAISASPQLHGFHRLALHHHVIFTDDGATPWVSAERMHKARRSVCKNWWNAEWRDRLSAVCAELGGDQLELELLVGGEEPMRVAMTPQTFVSPWSYFEDNETGLNESAEIELIEDADEDADGDDNADSE